MMTGVGAQGGSESNLSLSNWWLIGSALWSDLDKWYVSLLLILGEAVFIGVLYFLISYL